MNYISAKEVAKLWGISQRRVAILCSTDRIPNAKKIGSMWLIPKYAKKPNDGRSARKYMKEKRMRPFIKWAGGKGQLVDEIKKYYPVGIGKTIKKYAEPFVGGGAVLLDILNKYELDEVYISDSNAELINTYQVIRDNVNDLIALLSKYQDEYIPLDDDSRKEYYYKKRKRFNNLKCEGILDTEISSLFIFLNKTCFNGLYRVNSNGEYNVPIGSYKAPLICDADNLHIVSKALSNVTIRCADYRESSYFIDSNTFAYFDPPYRPLNATSSFTSYTENVFDDKAQEELAGFIKKLSDKGAFVVASNSDPKNINPNDEFFDDLYSEMTIIRIPASRMINSKGSSRGKINELLIHNGSVK